MRFVTFRQGAEQHIGVLTEDRQYIIPLSDAEQVLLGEATLPDCMLGLIKAGDAAVSRVKDVVAAVKENKEYRLLAAGEAQLLAPIPRPAKNIFCVGKNYVEHALEFEVTKDVNVAVPKDPVIFTKPPTCVIGPGAVVKNFKELNINMDYEVELAVVIGKKASGVTKEQAYEHVFGYTILNDVTARDLQKKHMQWIMGKGPDTFGPMGPCIADKDSIPNPHALSIKCSINGELRQNGHTGNMIFDIPTLIATISSVITLEPGDIIATGTPSGVGAGYKPPRFLQSGDIMKLEIEGIGCLQNSIE